MKMLLNKFLNANALKAAFATAMLIVAAIPAYAAVNIQRADAEGPALRVLRQTTAAEDLPRSRTRGSPQRGMPDSGRHHNAKPDRQPPPPTCLVRQPGKS